MATKLPIRHAIILALLTIIHLAAADQVYYFTGAIWLKGNGGQSYAVPAQCPAQHPIGCGSIGEPDYCCPSGNICQWSNSQVACCPSGCTCNGWGSGAGAGGYHPTSWYATTTQWVPQSTYVAPAQSTYVAPAAVGGYQQYCSTLYAHGPNLPTTAQGQCGEILVMDPDDVPAAAGRFGISYWRLGVMVGVLQMLGGALFVWR